MGRHSTKITPEAPSDVTQVNALTPPDSPSSKKRKREDPSQAEIEVDITAPEPPSKKALRKAKRDIKTTTKANAADLLTKESDVPENAQGEDSVTLQKPLSRSEYSIWIGNLSWMTSKTQLRDFFADHLSDAAASITRLHLPPPSRTTLMNSPQKIKPQNKGFAYVDFATEETLQEALSLSEKLFSGRKVLIKDAKSFEGRPEKPLHEAANGIDTLPGKPPNERIFVGNLRFETTKEDLQEHFEKCGIVEDVFLATFEDSGKCKGYGWVTFKEVDAAKNAVRGWVELVMDAEEEDPEQEKVSADVAEAGEGTNEHGRKAKKKSKMRKWWINRFQGNSLRTEFAESKDVRYKKRYGKGGSSVQKRPVQEDGVEDLAMTASEETDRGSKAAGTLVRRTKMKAPQPEKKVDARSIKPGAALAAAPRLTGAIVESKGKKTTFGS